MLDLTLETAVYLFQELCFRTLGLDFVPGKNTLSSKSLDAWLEDLLEYRVLRLENNGIFPPRKKRFFSWNT